jgi:hypothetical protein
VAEQLKKKSRTIPNEILDRLESYDQEFLVNNSGTPSDIRKVRTTAEMVAYLESNPGTELEARVLGYNTKKKRIEKRSLDQPQFVESFIKNKDLNSSSRKFREAYKIMREDSFAGGGTQTVNQYGYSAANSGLIGDDFVPLLGGPFYKQLYYYNDYLAANSAAFFAYHHDPIARAILDIQTNFVVGRGFRVDCDNPIAMAYWRAFEDANDLQLKVRNICTEIGLYGETMIWWLPNNMKYFAYKPGPNEIVQKAIIPRIRVLDPTNINEIVTAPEDIENKLFYVWINPTQYQIFTGMNNGGVAPVAKFIYQQVPATEIDHYKINCVSNEKRGRSDLYPILGYLKRLRDSVNYSIVAQQKASAWSIDTTIEGDDTDLQAYVQDQLALGTLPPAGSEHVHTAAIKREYLGNQKAGGKDNMSFNWCLNMVAAGSGIPISYLGMQLGGGSTRAGALVATEPVAKKFEMRQLIIERIIKDMAKRLFANIGIQKEIEVTFPEIIVQDRTAKLKDLYLAEEAHWLSPERCGNIAAKEFNITEYDYKKEKASIEKSMADIPGIIKGDLPPPIMAASNPLTAPAAQPTPNQISPSAVTGNEKKRIGDNRGA